MKKIREMFRDGPDEDDYKLLRYWNIICVVAIVIWSVRILVGEPMDEGAMMIGYLLFMTGSLLVGARTMVDALQRIEKRLDDQADRA